MQLVKGRKGRRGKGWEKQSDFWVSAGLPVAEGMGLLGKAWIVSKRSSNGRSSNKRVYNPHLVAEIPIRQHIYGESS